MAIESGGGGGEGKRQRVDALDGRSEAEGSDTTPVDRISALPDELRLRLLTLLALKDAIRTGALARGWRDLWKRRWPHDASLKVHLRSRDDPQRELDALEREPRRRLDRFSLNVGISTLKASGLRRFLEYAAECGVEDLHVETTRSSVVAGGLNFHLPLLSPALACLSLCHISVPSKFHYNGVLSFHALEVIRLVWVSFRRQAFGKMMALCPRLLTLDLRCCQCIGNGGELHRLPPNVRILTIAERGRFTSLDFVGAPTLRSFRYSGCSSNLPFCIPREMPRFLIFILRYHTHMTQY